MPDEIHQELVESHPWLEENKERSLTESEILHGVLNNPEMAKHAFFYFRNSASLDSLPLEQRADFSAEDEAVGRI